jgi:hypothetical protein
MWPAETKYVGTCKARHINYVTDNFSPLGTGVPGAPLHILEVISLNPS